MEKSTKNLLLIGGGLFAVYYFMLSPSSTAAIVPVPVGPTTGPIGGSAAPASSIQTDIQNWISGEPNATVRQAMSAAVAKMSQDQLSLLDVIYEYIHGNYNPALLTAPATAFYNSLVAQNVGFHW